jgi:hypothetical protein
MGGLQSEKKSVNGKYADAELTGLTAWESGGSIENIRDKPGICGRLGLCLTVAFVTPMKDVFDSIHPVGVPIGQFAPECFARILGVGDDGLVLILFQDFFHRTSVDVHMTLLWLRFSPRLSMNPVGVRVRCAIAASDLFAGPAKPS